VKEGSGDGRKYEAVLSRFECGWRVRQQTSGWWEEAHASQGAARSEGAARVSQDPSVLHNHTCTLYSNWNDIIQECNILSTGGFFSGFHFRKWLPCVSTFSQRNCEMSQSSSWASSDRAFLPAACAATKPLRSSSCRRTCVTVVHCQSVTLHHIYHTTGLFNN